MKKTWLLALAVMLAALALIGAQAEAATPLVPADVFETQNYIDEALRA